MYSTVKQYDFKIFVVAKTCVMLVLCVVPVAAYTSTVCVWYMVEKTFLSLVLPVLSSPLQRDTLKRMCFKTLPPVMVVHLKRFDYDWEANRAIKFDDYFEVGCHLIY